MSASSKRTSANSNSLPPISPRLCSCDVHNGRFVDRHVQDIEKFVHEETKALGEQFHASRKERFGVFKKAFEMLIDESTCFKPLLADINAEYLGVTKAVEKGEQQRAYISRDLKCVVGEKFTTDNYEKRIQELESKAKLIKTNNNKLRMKYEHDTVEDTADSVDDVQKTAPTYKSTKHYRILLPGLELEEQTDIDVLSSALKKLQAEVQAMQDSMKFNFYPKAKKISLEHDLKEKETSHNHVSRYNKTLREKLGQLTIAVEVTGISSCSDLHEYLSSISQLNISMFTV